MGRRALNVVGTSLCTAHMFHFTDTECDCLIWPGLAIYYDDLGNGP
jgi:hypothetical protein